MCISHGLNQAYANAQVMGLDVDGTTALDLSAADAGTQINWSCAGGNVIAKFRPANCR